VDTTAKLACVCHKSEWGAAWPSGYSALSVQIAYWFSYSSRTSAGDTSGKIHGRTGKEGLI